MTGFTISSWHEHMSCEFFFVMLRRKDWTETLSDAFALNVGREDWQKLRVVDGYEAALQLHTEFKLFLSFDMT